MMIKIRRAHNKYKRMRADIGKARMLFKAQMKELGEANQIVRDVSKELVISWERNRQQEGVIANQTKRISELQSTIDSLKRQNRELQAELIAKDSIIKKQTILMEEVKPKEAKYIKAGNQYYCSNCEADFQHYELFNKYCPECGAHFTNSRKEQA